MNSNSKINSHSKDISMFPRPLPYFNTGVSSFERQLAASLRKDFIPKIKKRLPAHHLRGFPHNFIVNYVAAQKQQYPFFIRTDIEKFYPSIEHREMIVNLQMAYKELLSLPYVPSAFRKKYVANLYQWCKNLPLTRGIPIGSPLSAILAPIMLIPLWLQIKKIFNTPVLVFMDDILIFAKSQEQLTDIYIYLENSLAENFKLKLNLSKTVTGRFASASLHFCGWEFVGGYAHIHQKKIELFMERLHTQHKKAQKKSLKAYVKSLNRKIDGIGNYYKYGNVRKQFDSLDVQIRKLVRKKLKNEVTAYATNSSLKSVGLHSLSEKLKKTRCGESRASKRLIAIVSTAPQPRTPVETKTIYDAQYTHELMEKMIRQLSQLIDLNRKLLCSVANAFSE